jgi:Uma2 family endonuclease
MPPVGAISGNRESDFNGYIWLWNLQTKLGKVFSSSTVFTLPNGGKRSPDVAWIVNERWESLNIQEKEKFAKICPDFIIELRSRTDSLSRLQEKMQEYLDSGLRLGWLIDPQNQQVEIYRQNQTVEIVSLPTTLSGEDILPGIINYLVILFINHRDDNKPAKCADTVLVFAWTISISKPLIIRVGSNNCVVTA